ncbi:MAG: hypothetical protein ACJ71S_06360 [Acidobacteriaceae bacterium]
MAALRTMGPDAARLVTELESLDMAISNIATSSAGEYSGYRLAIDAIVAALTIHGRPMSGDELSREITAGGWLSKDGRARYNITDSVDYHTRRQGAKKKIIRAMNGLVGLYEWPDEMFGVQTT